MGSNRPTTPPPWLDADLRHVWHPYTQMQTAPPPLPVVAGEGAYLELADGRRVLDGISSWWVNIHGHAHPRLNAALAAQADRLAQVIFAGFTHQPAAELAEALVGRTPSSLNRVFFSDDGSTAVEVALKMAYQHWRNRGEDRRNLFVAFDGAYHGDTFGTMAAGGVEVFHSAFSDLFFEVRRARGPHGGATYAGAPASDRPDPPSATLEEILEREGDRVAAVILEPMVQAAGGMVIQPVEFLREVRRLTAERGIPLIADEIFTGFGRTGKLLACEHAGPEGTEGAVIPDLVCLSKGLTGGYLPLAVTLCTDSIYEAFLSDDRGRTFFHGHSFTGNALSCAVALESLRLFEDEDRLGRVGELEALFRRELASFEGDPRIADIRGLGAIAVLELAPAGEGGYLDDVGPRLAAEFLRRDLLLRPLGNVLYFLPPYVIDDTDVRRVFAAIGEVLDQVSPRAQ